MRNAYSTLKSFGRLIIHTNPRTVLLLAFAATLSVLLYWHLLMDARLEFGAGRILGWDTLVYAYSAQETRIRGVSWLLQVWGHPNLYVIALAGTSVLIGDVVELSNVVPIALIALLSFASGYLARRMGGLGAAFLAAALTATSFATFRLFVDLHRALLAFALVTVLLALGSFGSLTKLKLGLRGVFALVLLFFVAFSEFEIYLAFVATTVLMSALTRKKGRWHLPILWSLIPGLLFALTPSANITFSFLVAANPSISLQPLPLDHAFLYLSVIASLPLAVIGMLALFRTRKSGANQYSTALLSWVVTILLVLVVYSVILGRVSAFRPLLLLHIPVLAAIGLERITRFLFEAGRKARQIFPESRFMNIGPQDQTHQVGFVLLAASLVLLSGIQLKENANTFLEPVVAEDLYKRLVESSHFVDRNEWGAPIYLVLNQSHIPSLTAIRYQLSVLNGPTYLYFGDMNFLPWALPPQRIDPSLTENFPLLLTLCFEYRQMRKALEPGPLGTLAHPIVILQPELFPRSLPSQFQRYNVGDGLYVIPPNSLSLDTFLTWQILPEEDAYSLGEAYPVERNWSFSQRVVEIYTSEGYEISFPHYFPVSGRYTISIRLFDFPEMDVNTTTPLSPLELYVADTLVDTLMYGTVRPIWWNATADLDKGFKVITLRTATDDLPFRLSLDMIVVTAEGAGVSG